MKEQLVLQPNKLMCLDKRLQMYIMIFEYEDNNDYRGKHPSSIEVGHGCPPKN